MATVGSATGADARGMCVGEGEVRGGCSLVVSMQWRIVLLNGTIDAHVAAIAKSLILLLPSNVLNKGFF